jgi:hypothetical protein
MKSLINFAIFFFIALVLNGQEIDSKPNPRWGIKAGLILTFDRIVDEPLTSGRGLGCSVANILDSSSDIGAKFGVFYQLPLGGNFSINIGPELLYRSGERNYDSYLTCIRGKVSESVGQLAMQQLSGHLMALIRLDTEDLSWFFEVGGYSDLEIGQTSTFTYSETTFLNSMFQPYPVPLIEEGKDKLQGSSFGFIFGLGNKKLLRNQNIELGLRYYLNLAKTVPLGDYRYLSQQMVDFSMSYRF